MSQSVDETEIRKDVLSRREVRFKIREDWLTHSGRTRQAPMYLAQIQNEFLGAHRQVTGRCRVEVDSKAREQIEKWTEKEIQKRIQQARHDLVDEERSSTEDAQASLDAIRGILTATLSVDDRIDWDSLLETGAHPSRDFVAPEPPAPLEGSFWIRLIYPIWRRRKAAHEDKLRCHAQAVKRLKTSHDQQEALARARFETARKSKNESIRKFQFSFESGDSTAVEEYLAMVFERSSYPQDFSPSHDCHLEVQSKTLVVNLDIPPPDSVPNVAGYKVVDRRTRLDPVLMKPKEVEELYDLGVKLCVLRTLHETFEAVYVPVVEAVVVNGFVTTVDRATGNDVRSCVISVSTDRETFSTIRLDRVDPTECIKSLKGLVAGPLSGVVPVKPILMFDRRDRRFVESKDILDEVDSEMNLADMPWEDFEYLVRELFGKIFSGEDAEVKVTQASRDQGVDAIAFDPDPIRGGKFVIQAKRYTQVVPVSAVRDLYGTMINEGAAKGILVTTSHYGRDSREFSKDKPITLIDGSNLVYLLEEHGHHVRIDVEESRSRRRN